MQQNAQFILMNRDEFFHYIMNLQVNRHINLIQNHHTAEPSYKDFNGSNHIQMMQAMKEYHVTQAGFSDIAQQFSTFPDGLICTGRTMDKDPAGIFGVNQGAICLEHVGYFDIGRDNMTPEHKLTIAFLNAVLCLKFNLLININTVVYHTWFGYLSPQNVKTCPGTNFFGGNSKESAQANFYPLIQNEINKIKNPQPVIAQWEYDACLWLKQSGFIQSDHNPHEQITFGLYGSIMNNKFNNRTPNVDPIAYLFQTGVIKEMHDPREPVTIGTFAYMLLNHFHDTLTTSPVNYLLMKGFLKEPRNPQDVLTFGVFGAILKNGASKGLNL